MLLYKESASLALDLVATTDFFRSAHQTIYASMARLVEDGIAPDFVTVKNDLADRNELESIGGPAYLSGLADGIPRSTNLEHYIGIIKEKRRLRDIVFFAQKVSTAAYGGGTPSRELLGQADMWMSRLVGADQIEDLVKQDVAVPPFIQAMEHRLEHKYELLGVSSGFPTLDEMTCGLVPGDMTVLAGIPSTGKTAMALQVALHAAALGQRSGQAVVLISVEMQRMELLYREAARLAGVELFKIRKGWFFSRDVFDHVTASIRTSTPWPLYTCDLSDVTILDIRSQCRRLRAQTPIALIVVDYLQLLAGDGSENRTIELGNIARDLKRLGRQVGASMLVLSQLSREHQKKKRRPEMHDIRESGAIEQHSDNIFMLYKDEDKADSPTELLIRKQRNGPLGTVEFVFEKTTQTFRDLVAEKASFDRPAPTQADIPNFS